MSTLNVDKLYAACPELEDIKLDGVSDYNQIKAALLKARIKPANKLVWAVINHKNEIDQLDSEDFFD